MENIPDLFAEIGRRWTYNCKDCVKNAILDLAEQSRKKRNEKHLDNKLPWKLRFSQEEQKG